MNAKLKEIEWGPIKPEGDAMIQTMVAEEYNAVAINYGAKPIAVPRSSISKKQNTRYKLKSAGEVLSAEPIRWRIKGVVPERGIAAIYGPSGSGKSFLVLDMAMSIAKGLGWFGYRVTECPVVYCCLEGEAGLSVRLSAYQSKNKTAFGIHFIDQPINLLNPKDVRDLVLAITACNARNGIIIVDTLNRAAPGMDENSSVDMGNAINAAKLIQQAVGGLVLLVHHSGKDSSKGMRGHSSLHAALDAAIEVRRSCDGRDWSVAKAKDGQDGKSHPFVLDVIELGLDADGDPITSCVIRPADGTAKPKPLSVLQKLGIDSFMAAASKNVGSEDLRVHARYDQWRGEFLRRSAGDNAESKTRSFRRVRNELIEMGKLFVRDDVYTLSDSFPNLSKEADKPDNIRTNPPLSARQ